MRNGRKVLLTGATGFVGRTLMDALRFHPDVGSLLGIGRRVGVSEMMKPSSDMFKCDVTDKDAVKRVMLDFEPDLVFHLAANPLTRHNPAAFLDNITGTVNLLEYCPHGARFVFMSSGAVYGDLAKTMNGGCPEHKGPLSPTSLYGVSKLLGEGMIRVYAQQGRVNGVAVRPCAIVGNGMTHGLVYDIIRKLEACHPTLNLIGKPPGSFKPFVHVTDVVDALIKIGMATWPIGRAINISSNDPRTVADVAMAVMDEMGIHQEIKWTETTWAGDNPVVNISSAYLREYFHWEPRYENSLEAIRATVKEYKQKCKEIAC